MAAPVKVTDNFLSDPDKVRQEFQRLPFYDVRGPDREMYRRVSVRPTDEFQAELSKAVGRPIQQGYSLARLNYANELPNHSIHSDSGYDQFAAVLYLNAPEHCAGGTAFWRHKKTGWEFLPTEQQVRALGKSPARTLRELSESWNDESSWEQTGLVEMRPGRAIVYPTIYFHSRFPFEAFGSTPEDGRLVWCSFFSTL